MNTNTHKNLLRHLPAIEKLLNTHEMLDLQATYARSLVTETLRTVVADVRNDILSGNQTQLPESTEYAERTHQKILEKIGARMRLVVNATGTVTHTNLGRSLLSTTTCEASPASRKKLC